MSDIAVFQPGGGEAVVTFESFHARLQAARMTISSPFTEQRLGVAASVGSRLLANRARFADTAGIAHFGYWTRRSELRRLSGDFSGKLPPNCMAQSRGLVFHIPPRNVETVFLYSWIISYLVGNANVVRLPSELSAAMHDAVQCYIDALAEAGDPSQLFVRYPASSATSAQISACADARIVWGGDAKVAEFSMLPLRHGGKSLWFGDRFSLSVIKGAALANADDQELQQLANNFATDIYVFDQMACSSPHVIYVVGSPDAHGNAVNSLTRAIVAAAQGRGFAVETGHAIRKMVVAYEAVAVGASESVDISNPTLSVVTTSHPSQLVTRVGGGFLQVCYLGELSDLRDLVDEHYQTLSYFGFSDQELGGLFPLPKPLGITRIVPVGQALNFDSIWDGYDLPRELTRLIKIG